MHRMFLVMQLHIARAGEMGVGWASALDKPFAGNMICLRQAQSRQAARRPLKPALLVDLHPLAVERGAESPGRSAAVETDR
jgi:hypothetical protein